MRASRQGRTVLLTVILLLSIGFAAAEWQIDVLEDPQSYPEVSNQTDTVQIVNITTESGHPINQSLLDGRAEYFYTFDGILEAVQLRWLEEGYWYAYFPVNTTGGEVLFEAQGQTTDPELSDQQGEPANATRELQVGNLSVETHNDFSERKKAGSQEFFEVNVTDEYNNQNELNAEVFVQFVNGSWSSGFVDLGYNSENQLYTNTVSLPDKTNKTYAVHVYAINTDAEFDNAEATHSQILNTYPSINGHVERMETDSGCNNQSFFTECERDAELETGFNITQSSADNVNLTMLLHETETEEWQNVSTVELDYEEGLYTGSISIPDVNTSVYDKTVRLMYNATNEDREEIVNYDINYRSFSIEDKSSSVTTPGSYEVRTEFSRFFTPQLIEPERINGKIEVWDPSGELFTEFNIEEMDLNSLEGAYTREINIPTDSETGIYTVIVEAENIYQDFKTKESNFRLESLDKTFGSPESIDYEFNKTGNFTGYVEVENVMDSNLELEADFSEEIEDKISLEESEIILESGSTSEIMVNFDISYVDDYSGEMVLEDVDTGYNRTTNVYITSPTCTHRDGAICIHEQGLNASADERTTVERSFDVKYLGDEEEERDIQVMIDGNISNYVSLSPSQFTLNSSNDTEIVQLNHSIDAPGYFEGNMTVETEQDESLRVLISQDADVEAQDVSIDLPGTIDLGEIPDGEDTSYEVTFENTGSVYIDELSVSSSDYSIEADTTSIEPGETQTFEIVFQEVETGSGQITVDVLTEAGDVSRSISVNADIIPDYDSQADALESRAMSLDSQTNSEDIQSEITDIQMEIQDVKTAYRQQNYEQAESLYNELERRLDTAEAQIQSEAGNGGSDPGTETGSEGIGLFLPLMIVMFVFLLVGFVAYTSIEPEEGDPLYSVLGE